MNNQNGHVQTYPVAIIGAGPIGIEMAVALKRQGVDYVQFDANQLGHTIAWWPRNTNFFSTTERLAISGIPIQNNHQQRITGEEYLAYLRQIVEQYDLQIRAFEPVTNLIKQDDHFLLTTQARDGVHHTRAENVILAIGDMHHPNALNIQGEDLPHVTHYFNDAHDYFRQRLLIVGGKNSAVEAALRCWRAGVDVTISYRRDWFNEQRVKHWLMPDLKVQIENGGIGFLPSTAPVAITPTHVELKPTVDGVVDLAAESIWHPTDFVFLATGHRGDQALLREAGVVLNGENRVPQFNPDTMETNVAGLYLVGTVAAGIQQRYTVFIENAHEHVGKVMQDLVGFRPKKLGTVPQRNYHMPLELFEAN